MLVSQEEIHRLEHMVYLLLLLISFQKQLNEEEFMKRISEFEDKKREKILKMQDDYKDKDLEGCTFHPQLVSNLKSSSQGQNHQDE
jgi:hypothetical protein